MCTGNVVISKVIGREYITSKNRAEFKHFMEGKKEVRRR